MGLQIGLEPTTRECVFSEASQEVKTGGHRIEMILACMHGIGGPQTTLTKQVHIESFSLILKIFPY
jgi:hypothetical protein